MPISFGTSTTVISLPDLSGALFAWPPSKGLAAAGAAAPPASQASGLVGRSSAPSHLLAAFAPPAANDRANIAAAVVVNKLAFIFDSSLDAAIGGVGPPKAPCSVAAAEGTCDQHRKNKRDADDDDCRVALDARQRQPILEELDHREADQGAPDGAGAAENAGSSQHDRGDHVELVAAPHIHPRGRHPRNQNPGGKTRCEAGQRVDDELDPID